MRSTASHHAYSNRPMDRERKQVLAETVQNLDESQIEGDHPLSSRGSMYWDRCFLLGAQSLSPHLMHVDLSILFH